MLKWTYLYVLKRTRLTSKFCNTVISQRLEFGMYRTSNLQTMDVMPGVGFGSVYIGCEGLGPNIQRILSAA